MYYSEITIGAEQIFEKHSQLISFIRIKLYGKSPHLIQKLPLEKRISCEFKHRINGKPQRWPSDHFLFRILRLLRISFPRSTLSLSKSRGLLVVVFNVKRIISCSWVRFFPIALGDIGNRMIISTLFVHQNCLLTSSRNTCHLNGQVLWQN